MTRVALSLHRIEARFSTPHGDARSVWEGRQGVAVKATCEGRTGLGEASPLPGRSSETFDEGRDSLMALGGSIELEEPTVGRMLELPSLPPSARFGLETALLDLFCQRANVSLAQWLFTALHEAPGAPPSRVETQVLCDRLGDLSPLERAPGARAVKVKIARPGQHAEEAAMLRAIRALRPDIELRVDANGIEPHPDLIDVIIEVRCALVEDPGDFERLDDSFAVPVAIDDHVARDPRTVLAAIDRGWVTGGVVLKPTLIGGLDRALVIGGHAHRAGPFAIASHTYESPIGMAAAAHLGLALGAWTFHGLGLWDGLDRFTLDGEPIPVPKWIGPCAITLPERHGLGVP